MVAAIFSRWAPCCHELLSYQKAFEADTPHLVLLKILQAEPPPIREIVPDISASLERILASAMAKDPDARYQNLDLLAADLTQVTNSSNAAVFGGPTLQMPSLPRTVVGMPGGVPVTTPPRQESATPMGATVIVPANNEAIPSRSASPIPGEPEPVDGGSAASSKRPLWIALAAVIAIGGVLAAYRAARESHESLDGGAVDRSGHPCGDGCASVVSASECRTRQRACVQRDGNFRNVEPGESASGTSRGATIDVVAWTREEGLSDRISRRVAGIRPWRWGTRSPGAGSCVAACTRSRGAEKP